MRSITMAEHRLAIQGRHFTAAEDVAPLSLRCRRSKVHAGGPPFQFFVSVTLLRRASCSVRNGGGGSIVGSSKMPRPSSHNFAFEPEHIQAMHWAFEAVCVTLQLSMGSDDKVTELVALKVIELAVTGERNADRLTARVLAEFGIGNDGSLWPH